MVETKTKIGNYTFNNCVMNASGVLCTDFEDLERVDQSVAATFVTKTATLEAREGNPLPRVQLFGSSSINSSGLPNLGIDYYLDALAKFEANQPDKTYFLSITELSPDNIQKILHKVNDSDFKGLVELNLSCPNVIGKPQVAYDFELVQDILDQAFTYFTKPMGVKLPPYFDLSHFDDMANILNQFPLTYINSINSIGNGLVIEDETVVIKPKQGFGGLGGSVVKQTALANVHAFYQRLKPEIAIIGTGGVTCGRDVFEHILCGASMVQVGSSLYPNHSDIFSKLTDELIEIMESKGYQSLADFKGKLKYMV